MPAISSASVASFTNLLFSCYDRVKQECGLEMDRWHNKKEAAKLYKHIHNIRMVKTIWDPETAIDLSRFYCPPRIKTKQGSRTLINSIDDLPNNRNIIQGIAGQGKSILLRHLCSVELDSSKRIPLFIELRKITSSATLMKRIEECFTDFSLTYNEEAFGALYEAGKLCLLLDGFDEVDESERPSLIWDIETLSKRFPALIIVITARPESEICASSFFEVTRLTELQGDEYKNVINKLLGNDPVGRELQKAIEAHKNNVVKLLTTPLLATLLTITYKTFEKIPDQLSEFYDSIFDTLVWRHDKLKPGYRRPRKSGISDTDFRRIFEAFCFYAKEHAKASYTADAVHTTAEKAIDVTRSTIKADAFLADVIGITCLVVRDSTEHRFIHRSIQEFFAAAYLTRRPTKVLEGFYSQLKLRSNYFRFRGELNFLESIDRYRYIQLYVIPSSQDIFIIDDIDKLATLSTEQRDDIVERQVRGIMLEFTGSHREGAFGNGASLGIANSCGFGHFHQVVFHEIRDIVAGVFDDQTILEIARKQNAPRPINDRPWKLSFSLEEANASLPKPRDLRKVSDSISRIVYSQTTALLKELRDAELEQVNVVLSETNN